MGNIVSDPLDKQLILNSRLRDIITDWAKTDYDAGLSWGKTNLSNETINLKNVLRKRACCTRQTVMNVALPIVDINSTTPSGVIKPGYTPVKIRVFEDGELTSTPASCSFLDESQPNEINKFSYLRNENCSALYQSGGTNLGLCNKIKKENMSTYKKDPAQSAYGFYAADRKVVGDNSLDNYNNYTDCNCENSILRDVPLPAVLGFQNINNREVFVQSNDSYCSACASNGKCYVSSRQAVNTLCINIAEIQNSLVEGASNLTNIQTCNANNTGGQTDLKDPELDPDWASKYISEQKKTTSSIALQPKIIIPQNDNTTIFIIAINILVAIIIIGVIIFKLYKKNSSNNNEYIDSGDIDMETYNDELSKE